MRRYVYGMAETITCRPDEHTRRAVADERAADETLRAKVAQLKRRGDERLKGVVGRL